MGLGTESLGLGTPSSLRWQGWYIGLGTFTINEGGIGLGTRVYHAGFDLGAFAFNLPITYGRTPLFDFTLDIHNVVMPHVPDPRVFIQIVGGQEMVWPASAHEAME